MLTLIDTEEREEGLVIIACEIPAQCSAGIVLDGHGWTEEEIYEYLNGYVGLPEGYEHVPDWYVFPMEIERIDD